MTKKRQVPIRQHDRSVEKACELGYEEDERGFEEKLRRLAKAGPIPKNKESKSE